MSAAVMALLVGFVGCCDDTREKMHPDYPKSSETYASFQKDTREN